MLQPGRTDYEWEITDFKAPAKENLVIYELHIRDFVESQRIKDVTDSLNYFKELGINAIELMPINEFEGNNSWGYNPSFYFAADKQYGTPNDYKKFIDECHKNGIAVIIDMVLNHSFGQSPLLRLYANGWEAAADNPWYNTGCPHEPWCWGADFNHESPLVKDFIDRVNTYWITEYKVDGFRFDFTKGFTNKVSDGWAYDASRISILKRMADQIWNVNNNAYVILEHLADNSEEKVLANYGMMLWGNMNHDYNEAAMGYPSDLSGGSYKARDWSEPSLISYMESHDEERMMFKLTEWGNGEGAYNTKEWGTAIDRVELAATFFIPIPGPKMIWQFGELGYHFPINYCQDGTIAESCRVDPKPIRWDFYKNESRKHLYRVFGALNKLKTEHDVFKTTDFDLNLAGMLKSINLNHADMNVTILGNFGMETAEITPNFQHTGLWYNYFSGSVRDVTNIAAPISLKAGEYLLFTDVTLDTPNMALSLPGELEKHLVLFPNPATDELKVLSSEPIVHVEIYNMIGNKVMQTQISNKSINVAELNTGVYIFTAKTASGKVLINRFMKQ